MWQDGGKCCSANKGVACIATSKIGSSLSIKLSKLYLNSVYFNKSSFGYLITETGPNN